MGLSAAILVVDDEKSIRSLLEELLTREGHRVVAAASGEVALAQIKAREFDLALIDLKMKGISGIDFLSDLRKQAPDTVPIMLTGHGSLETAVEALRKGAHDYLFKPCKTDELRQSVRRGLLKRQQLVLQRALLDTLAQNGKEPIRNSDESTIQSLAIQNSLDKSSEQGPFLQIGSLHIDFMQHLITLDGHLLELSPTEFDILGYLCSQSPRVVSSQELVRQVQGYDSDATAARDIVRYHIYRIRQKVKSKTDRTNLIRTVRGIGYTIGDT